MKKQTLFEEILILCEQIDNELEKNIKNVVPEQLPVTQSNIDSQLKKKHKPVFKKIGKLLHTAAYAVPQTSPIIGAIDTVSFVKPDLIPSIKKHIGNIFRKKHTN